MADKNIIVTKASGEKVPFSANKLQLSLERAGAGEEDIDAVLCEVKSILYEEIPTKKIYQTAFRMLRKRSKITVARYVLKKAIMELGPTGYPFERFVGELLKYQGFKVQVGVMLPGQNVQHEIDVIAENDDSRFMVECKFHNRQGLKSDVKVPLYVHSRFLDVEKQWKKQPGFAGKFHQGWIVTNTRFTEDAINYGNGVGLKLIGWDYPKKGSLKERIDLSGLHPLTCLTSLTKSEKQRLLENNIVLCRELVQDDQILREAGIKENRVKKITREAELLYSGNQ